MKILMATMSLDIGGAETHILELSRELKRRGVEVHVASGGGVYVPQLEESGIRHFTVPLYTKKPAAVAQSLSALRRLIAREKYDVVHAHARIPAFVCGILAKTMDFRFVTTTHGVYDAPFYWRLLSNWGEQSLAVSYDVKQYLIDNYHIPSDNITITINGIDTNRFSALTPADDLVRECALMPKTKHRILYVSRIDRESAEVGFELLESASLLAADYADLEIVLVGGGTAFEELKSRAEVLNRMLGREVLRPVGPRTDVWRFTSVSDIFVGVSRSALEAMAAELPVVIAGAQGYIGILDESRLRAALDTNFCARGCGDSSVKLITADIRRLFSLTDEERAAMGRWNRRVVLERYSIARMADDALAVYDRVRPFRRYNRGDVILTGYYGFGNMGDDSLLQLIISSLRELEPDIRITVLSRKPKITAAHYNVRAVNRFDLPKIRREMKAENARLLLSGGGTLLTDITSERSLFYYTTVMKMAKKAGLKVMLYASGVGPLRSEKSRKRAAEALASADCITLRDRMSADTAAELGIPADRVTMTSDPAFRLQVAQSNWVRYVMNREGLGDGKKYFALCIRGGVTGIREEELEKLCFALRVIRESGGPEPVMVVLQPLYDDEVSQRLSSRLGCRLLRGLSASELTGLMAHMEFAVSMRLHLLIYAADAGIPVAALSRDQKLDALCDALGVPDCLIRLDDDLTSEVLLKTVRGISEHRAAYAAVIASHTEELRRRSGDDARKAVALLKQTEQAGR